MAILLENGKIFIGTGEVIEGGTVAIHDHLIAFGAGFVREGHLLIFRKAVLV
jgi:hypothetical protein